MKKYFKKFITWFCSAGLLILPYIVLAESSAYGNLKQVGELGEKAPWESVDPNSGTNSLAGIIGLVIQAFLGLLGVIFLAYLLFAGYSWMTAQGDEEKVTKAKDTITRAVIGVIIIIAAYAISYFVFDKLLTGTGVLQ